MSLIDDIRNLDPNNPGLWPFPIQLLAIALAALALLFAGWHFDLSDQRDVLAAEVQKEQDLKKTFETKQKKVANLKALKEQMEEMKQSFGDMLRQLPNKTEVAGLIVDISQVGLAAGLEFDLFKPGKEQAKEFYSELPIDINVKGNYHELGEFISGIAALPRIVTTHNINVSKANAESNILTMKAIAKTYRALEEGS